MQFLATIAALLLHAAAAAPSQSPDSAALSALYAAAGGSHWVRASGWLTAADTCTWEGVACAGGNVRCAAQAAHEGVWGV